MLVGNVVGEAAFLLVAAAKVLGFGHRGAGVLGVQLQALVLQALGGADGQRSPKGLDAGLSLAHHLALADLHQVADHQVVAADIVPVFVVFGIIPAVVLAAKGAVDAGVGVPGHVAVGGHLGSLGVDLVGSVIHKGAGGGDGHHIGTVDRSPFVITEISPRLACGLQVGFQSGTVVIVGLDLAGLFVLHSIIGYGAGELVEGTLVGVFVFAIEAVILIVIALAVLGVLGDVLLQAHLRVALALYQVVGVVVPFQLLALGKKHTVGRGYVAVLIRQLVHLGTGGQVQVGDVVSLLQFFGLSIPVRGRVLGVVLEVLITGVVVLQLLLILGALVHGHFCRFCLVGLGVQGGDEGLLGHIFVGHSRGKVLDDLLFLAVDVLDLQVTDPELLARLKCNGVYLLLQLLVQPFLCVLQVLVGLYGICHGDSLTDRFIDLQGLFAQAAVVDGNGGFADLVGGSLSSGIQSDLAIGFRELRSQHGLDGGFIQVLFFPKGKGVGDGLVAILLGGGVGAVRVLLQVLVDLAVLGLEGGARQGPGVVY